MAPKQQAVLFGGVGASNRPLSDTWIRQSGCWTEVHPSANPPSNTILASAYDASSAELVVLMYGGSGTSSYLDLSTWLWDGNNWRASPVLGPRVSAGQAAYDRASGQVILFGMADISGAGETWAWDGSSWSRLNPTTSPVARFNAAMVADPATNTILLFSGVNGMSRELLGDTWSWSGTQWTKLAPASSPPPRQEATVSPFARGGRTILIGGLGASGSVLADAWQWDGITWSTIPGVGANCCSVATDDGSEIVVFGGGNDHATGQTRLWNGTTWTTE